MTALGLQRSDAVPIGVRTTWSLAPSSESMTAMWLLPPMAAAGPTWVSAQVKTNAGYTNVSERLLLVFDIGER
jgi:hypothetical protein